MSERVELTIDEGVAQVRLNRPEKKNALDPEMFAALDETLTRLEDQPDLRSVVLTGSGGAFCAGLDVASFAKAPDLIPSLMRPLPGRDHNLAQRIAWGWRELPVPVIAALEGEVLGGGLQIALAADLRIAAPNVRLSVMEIRWGLIPDMSASQTLRWLVRSDVARELTYTGRMVGADEALDLGLVTRVAADPMAAALELARDIACRSPDAIRAAKQLFNAAWSVSTTDGLQREARLQSGLFGSPNQAEAVTANFERRAPVFVPAKTRADG
jgi:enoyl-CoA hydratase/carnithine racemase